MDPPLERRNLGKPSELDQLKIKAYPVKRRIFQKFKLTVLAIDHHQVDEGQAEAEHNEPRLIQGRYRHR